MRRLNPDVPIPIPALALIFAYAAICLPIAWLYARLDSDLVWQRRLGEWILANHALPHTLDGRSFAAPAAAWVPQEWLFSLGVASFERAHAWPIFATFVVGCTVVALAIAAYRAALRGAEPFAIALETGFTAVTLHASFGVRDQVVAWLPFSIVILFIELDGVFLWCTIPVVAIWANLHASVMLAPVLLGLAAIGAAIDDRGFSKRARARALVAACSLVAICCTPLGFELFPYALSLEHGFVRQEISEWQSPLFDDPRTWFGMLPVTIAILARGFGPRRSATDLLWFVAFLSLALEAVRHVPLLVLLAAPMAAAALTPPRMQRSMDRTRFLRRSRSVAIAVACTVGAFALAIPGAKLLEKRSTPAPDYVIPPAFVARIASLPGKRRLYCGDFGWCSTALEAPNTEVLMDGHADPYPQWVWREQSQVVRLAPTWKAILLRNRIDTLLIERISPIAQAIADTHSWRLLMTDKKFALWIRAS